MSKVILITGSTDGIGKLAAINLAKAGHKVYLHGRNAKKLSTVVEEAKSEANNENIKGFVADFSDLDTVKQMAHQVNNELSAIDVLVNNAGVFKASNPIVEGGLDIRMVVNYLAPVVLTRALLPLLKNSKAPLIINLSSAAQAPVSSQVLAGKIQVSAQEAYAQSKLAILMWSFYLAKQEPTISVIALNPGSLLNTNMVREAYGRFWSSADKGANIITDLAVSEAYQGSSGKYFDNDQGGFGRAHSDAYHEAAILKLIDETNSIINNKVA